MRNWFNKFGLTLLLVAFAGSTFPMAACIAAVDAGHHVAHSEIAAASQSGALEHDIVWLGDCEYTAVIVSEPAASFGTMQSASVDLKHFSTDGLVAHDPLYASIPDVYPPPLEFRNITISNTLLAQATLLLN